LNRNQISANGQSIEYEIVHRPAVTRRIHLELDTQGGLQVVAPRRMSKRAIQLSLQRKAVHVARFLAEARERQQQIPSYDYESGESQFFLGQKYLLGVEESPGKRAQVERSGNEIQMRLPKMDPEHVKATLVRWYRRQAQNYFNARLEWFSQLAPWTGGHVPEMRLRLMKRTWGSCSSRGVITLNPHLIKAPPECIDYVAAHEICHLQEHNHGKAFYALQEKMYPEWRKAKTHLRNKGHIYLHT
jgi:predicted metal-dependent hydrolase